ncbi:hypothetical protein ACNKHR_02610 [Shigella flexneri]
MGTGDVSGRGGGNGYRRTLFHAPQHPYTRALLAAVPQLGAMKGSDYPRRFPLISLEHPAKRPPHRAENGGGWRTCFTSA